MAALFMGVCAAPFEIAYAQTQQRTEFSFDIEAQPLSQALTEVARVTGSQVLFSYADLSTRHDVRKLANRSRASRIKVSKAPATAGVSRKRSEKNEVSEPSALNRSTTTPPTSTPNNSVFTRRS